MINHGIQRYIPMCQAYCSDKIVQRPTQDQGRRVYGYTGGGCRLLLLRKINAYVNGDNSNADGADGECLIKKTPREHFVIVQCSQYHPSKTNNGISTPGLHEILGTCCAVHKRLNLITRAMIAIVACHYCTMLPQIQKAQTRFIRLRDGFPIAIKACSTSSPRSICS
jgi:hypothetical protein